ncbi:hypothetical protein [Liberiplasma polymorphum]|uniref:hypothetical protein n=1 Tax=Liberiplasma polymorphum TaxID=3374570 RepID=UPI003773BAFB
MKEKNETPKRHEDSLYNAPKDDTLKEQVDFKKTSKSYFSLLRNKAFYYGILFLLIMIILAIILGTTLN